MAELSPQAQAVLDAADSTLDQAGTTRQGIAAALCAAADQVVPETNRYVSCIHEPVKAELQHVRDRFFAIATELENPNG